jgi:hypothetical protein
MAKQDQVTGRVRDRGNGRFQIERGDQPNEADIDLELPADGTYEVAKLRANVGGPNGLPREIEGNTIRWFNNFSIKQNGNYIKKKYKVRIPDLGAMLGKGKLVIYSDTHDPKLYYYDGTIDGDTFELTDGDPATGGSP